MKRDYLIFFVLPAAFLCLLMAALYEVGFKLGHRRGVTLGYQESETLSNATVPEAAFGECPPVHLDCSPRPCKTCTETMCMEPPSCSEMRPGDMIMMEELQRHREQLVGLGLYNEGSYDMLTYIEASQQIEEWPNAPWSPIWSPDFEMMSHDTQMMGWETASYYWREACQEIVYLWSLRYPEFNDQWMGDPPGNFPSYCL